jgi:hypothetical protein
MVAAAWDQVAWDLVVGRASNSPTLSSFGFKTGGSSAPCFYSMVDKLIVEYHVLWSRNPNALPCQTARISSTDIPLYPVGLREVRFLVTIHPSFFLEAYVDSRRATSRDQLQL